MSSVPVAIAKSVDENQGKDDHMWKSKFLQLHRSHDEPKNYLEPVFDIIAGKAGFVCQLNVKLFGKMESFTSDSCALKRVAEQQSAKRAYLYLVSRLEALGKSVNNNSSIVQKPSDKSSNAPSTNYKGRIIEFCQKKKYPLKFDTISTGSNIYKSTLTISLPEEVWVVEECGFTKKQAEHNVALKALERFTDTYMPASAKIKATSSIPKKTGEVKEIQVKIPIDDGEEIEFYVQTTADETAKEITDTAPSDRTELIEHSDFAKKDYKGKLQDMCEKLNYSVSYDTRREGLNMFKSVVKIAIPGQSDLIIEGDYAVNDIDAELNAAMVALSHCSDITMKRLRPSDPIKDASSTKASRINQLAVTEDSGPVSALVPRGPGGTINYKGKLLEMCQKYKYSHEFITRPAGCGFKSTLQIKTPLHQLQFEGEGAFARKQAEQNASMTAYDQLTKYVALNETLKSVTTEDKTPIALMGDESMNDRQSKSIDGNDDKTSINMNYKGKILEICQQHKFTSQFDSNIVPNGFKCTLRINIPGQDQLVFEGEGVNRKQSEQVSAMNALSYISTNLSNVLQVIKSTESLNKATSSSMDDETVEENSKKLLHEFLRRHGFDDYSVDYQHALAGGYNCTLRMMIGNKELVIRTDREYQSKRLAENNVCSQAMEQITKVDFRIDDFNRIIKRMITGKRKRESEENEDDEAFPHRKLISVDVDSSKPVSDVSIVMSPDTVDSMSGEAYVYCAQCGHTIGAVDDFMFYFMNGIDCHFGIKPEALHRYRDKYQSAVKVAQAAAAASQSNILGLQSSRNTDIEKEFFNRTASADTATSCDNGRSNEAIDNPNASESAVKGAQGLAFNFVPKRFLPNDQPINFFITQNEKYNKLCCGSCNVRLGSETLDPPTNPSVTFFRDKIIVIGNSIPKGKRWLDDYSRPEYAQIEIRLSKPLYDAIQAMD